MKKTFTSVLCVVFCLMLALTSAVAEITFGEAGTVSFGGEAVSMQAITNAVAEQLGVKEGDVIWTVTDAENTTASFAVTIGQEAGAIGNPGTAASATASINGQTVVVLMNGASSPVAGTPEVTMALAAGIAVQVYGKTEDAAAVEPAKQYAPKCKSGYHHYIWVNAKYPTCTLPGWRDLKCDICGFEYREKLAAKGHVLYQDKKHVDPTCTKDGKGGVWEYCSRCGVLLTPGVTYEKLKHNYVNGVCTRCNAKQKK